MKLLPTFVIIFITYILYVAWYLSSEYKHSVDIIITDSSNNFIPTFLAKSYLSINKYSVSTKQFNEAPAFFYVATQYGEQGFNKSECLWLLREMLASGVNINFQYQGYTALNGAILANEPELVKLLLEYGASTKVQTNSPTSKKCQNLESLEFAECINSLGKKDLSNIISILKSKT